MSRTKAESGSRVSSRDALLAAAFEEFSTSGYESTTVAGIAERAGVTTGALYAHFDSKLDLLIETLGLASIGRFWRRLARASTLPWNEMVEELASGLARKPDRRTLLLLDIIVVARRDPEVAARIREGFDSYLGAMHRATEKGARAGLIDPAFEPENLAQVMAALSFGIMILDVLGTDRPSLPTLTTLIDLLLKFDNGHGARGLDADSGSEPAPLARVRQRTEASQQATAHLHAAIAAAAAEGYSLRRIGEAAGLSHEKVRSVVASTAAPSRAPSAPSERSPR
jgi:AcrR family transcriptional regulator